VEARSGVDLVEGLVVRRVAADGTGPGLPDVERIWATQYPNLVRQELAMGETVRNHTLHHDEHLDREPLPIVTAEIDGGAAAIQAASGHHPTCYRPRPAGGRPR
jgi:peptidoglycan/xylan/chitin deacetylase (PgdA/CDA1 family)